jgi:hypothetical protein
MPYGSSARGVRKPTLTGSMDAGKPEDVKCIYLRYYGVRSLPAKREEHIKVHSDTPMSESSVLLRLENHTPWSYAFRVGSNRNIKGASINRLMLWKHGAATESVGAELMTSFAPPSNLRSNQSKGIKPPLPLNNPPLLSLQKWHCDEPIALLTWSRNSLTRIHNCPAVTRLKGRRRRLHEKKTENHKAYECV